MCSWKNSLSYVMNFDSEFNCFVYTNPKAIKFIWVIYVTDITVCLRANTTAHWYFKQHFLSSPPGSFLSCHSPANSQNHSLPQETQTIRQHQTGNSRAKLLNPCIIKVHKYDSVCLAYTLCVRQWLGDSSPTVTYLPSDRPSTETLTNVTELACLAEAVAINKGQV